ncbi:phage holin family protein [Nocardioides sp. zg-536]|uniref:Phage holin family protein n=1 Tax=Nocardioides faecalis TaxID=2803858 RepID=A0A939BU88_9ACTN|nr:phage holin family protein [Nocardioides faecalis]MBM9458606.1 phage holin family protein [Nocardioides faecalis]MBS4752938.1 phage holin family protein [Nocardioides faecalis]QVI58606.1 phage holin family protein [Nocardioides faecalis]
MLRFLVRWAITAASIAVAAQLLNGISFSGATEGRAEIEDKIVPLLLVALILGIVTSFVKPLVTLLSLPFVLVTLGLFLLVINAAMLKLTAWLAGLLDLGFTVEGFWPAVGGAVIISITTWLLDALVGTED